MHFSKEYWQDGAVEVEFIPGSLSIEASFTTTAALTFTEPGKLVLTKNSRGWDIPGGHIEAGEDSLMATHREIDEEIAAKVVGEPLLLGHRITRELRPHAWSHKYPKVSALPLYIAFVTLSEEFYPQYEVTERQIIDVTEIANWYHHWSEQRAQIFAHAHRAYPQFFTPKH